MRFKITFYFLMCILFIQCVHTSFSQTSLTKGEELRRKGIDLKNNGEFKSALKYYNLSLTSFEQVRDSIGIANVYNNLGVVWYRLGDFSKCLYYYHESYKLFKYLNHSIGIAKVNHNLGTYYSQEERLYEEALEHFKISEGIYREYGDSIMLLGIFMNLSNVFSGIGENKIYNLDSAFWYSHLSLELAYQNQDSSTIGDLFMNIADLENERDSVDRALDYYKNAERIIESLGNDFSIATIKKNVGRFYLLEGDYEKSILINKRAFEVSKNADYWDFIDGTARNLSKAYEAIGMYDSALYYAKIFTVYNDSLYNQSKLEEIEHLKVRYETEKKDEEIKLKQARIQLTTMERNYLMIALVVAMILTVIIIFTYNKRQKILKKLREKDSRLHQQEVNEILRDQELKSLNSMLKGEEKERKRIAEDLHDRVGSMLSAVKLQLNPEEGNVMTLIDETAEEVRRISHNLETRVLNRFGLKVALEDLADKINQAQKITFELYCLDLDERLDIEIEINTYRIVQELVSNALKHSNATEIVVQVNRIEEQLIVLVEDDGVGFDTSQIKKGEGGMGLGNILSRTNELNGNFNIDSGKGMGSSMTVEIPL